MQRTRSLALLLALSGAGFLTLGPDTAYAQDAAQVFQGAGLIEIIPGGTFIADGATPSTVHVVALDPTGAPLTGLKLKATSAGGKVNMTSEVAPGLYAVEVVPQAVGTAGQLTVTIKGKTPAKASFETSETFTVLPPPTASVAVTANPAQLLLGQDGSSTVTFALAGPDGSPVNNAELAVSASVGTVENLTPMGDGRYVAKFTPPEQNFPQLAIITASDRRDPSKVFGFVVVPLMGKTNYPVQAPPNSSVMLNIGGREFGPTQASAAGKANLPIIVPPGVPQATLITVLDGQKNEVPIDLRVPETKRMMLLPMQVGVPGDDMLGVPVRVFVATPDGQPDTGARVVFATTAGSIGEAVHEGNGIYVGEWVPPVSNAQATATITASLKGSSTQSDGLDVTLVPQRPGALTLTSEPAKLGASTTTFKVFAKVLDTEGTGMARRNLVFQAAGASAQGATQDLRNGDYQTNFTTTGSGSVEMVASVRVPPTGNPLRRVLVFTHADTLVNDGRSNTMVTVLTVDEFGYPVGGVDVKLEQTGASGLPTEVKTNPNGVAHTYLTAGTAAGLVEVRATAGEVSGATAIVQAPAGIGQYLPISGDDLAWSATDAWRNTMPSLRVERDGAEGAVAGMMETGPLGVITNLTVVAEPNIVAAGGTVNLKIKAVDGEGRGVAGETLELMASAGQFGIVADQGGGDYSTSLSVPRGTTGEVKVSVSNQDGSASTFLKVPVSGEAAVVAQPDPQLTAQNTNAASGGSQVAKVKKPKPQKRSTGGEHPWLRIGGHFAAMGYAYEQQPLSATGPLLDNIVAIGGENGGDMAVPMGGAITVRGKVPSLPYLGWNAGFRMTGYSLTAPAFQDAIIPDYLIAANVDAVPRLPIALGDNELSIGARVGFRFDEMLYFIGSLDDAEEGLYYETLLLPGFHLGAQVAGEFGPVAPTIGFVYGFAQFQQPYAWAIDADVAVSITESIFVDAGFLYQQRSLEVVGDTSGNALGNLSDTQIMGSLGVGFQM